MPGRDGTGPRGQGPITGGGFGFCAESGTQNPQMGVLGRGNFYGARGGRGYRNRYYLTGLFGWQRGTLGGPSQGRGYGASGPRKMPPQNEAQFLKEQAQFLEQQLADIQKRMSTLGATENK